MGAPDEDSQGTSHVGSPTDDYVCCVLCYGDARSCGCVIPDDGEDRTTWAMGVWAAACSGDHSAVDALLTRCATTGASIDGTGTEAELEHGAAVRLQ